MTPTPRRLGIGIGIGHTVITFGWHPLVRREHAPRHRRSAGRKFAKAVMRRWGRSNKAQERRRKGTQPSRELRRSW